MIPMLIMMVYDREGVIATVVSVHKSTAAMDHRGWITYVTVYRVWQ